CLGERIRLLQSEKQAHSLWIGSYFYKLLQGSQAAGSASSTFPDAGNANTLSLDLEQARDTRLDANYTTEVREKIGKVVSGVGNWVYGVDFAIRHAGFAAEEDGSGRSRVTWGHFAAAGADL
ncbi:MAG: hypothetical protein WD875_01390, partial [Pirellulales bacterium]